MEPITLCFLTFPQRYENGEILFHILIIPRNLNPLLPLKDGLPAFADAQLQFKAMVIDSLDGLPLTTNVSLELEAELQQTPGNTRPVWEAVKAQLEATDGMKVDDAETAKPEQKAESDIEKYKNVSIRKYLPESYRKAFNFVKPRTQYALTGDEYQCAVKNKDKQFTDEPSYRDTLSWGKVIAYCLRNPRLAEKAGLVYKASLKFPQNQKLFEEGGWLYAELAAGSDYEGVAKLQYAARIPSLKDMDERVLFAPVQFPVSGTALNNAGYDEVMREAIVYDEGFARIVHASQPLNQDLLQEHDKSNPPLKDIGIRLAWDDEQMAIWFNRQMLQKEEQTGNPITAPLGVFGYRIDVRTKGESRWYSQNRVIARQDTVLSQGNIQIMAAGEPLEPAVEVHPVSHGNSKEEGFWLPMYFASWVGKALSIADKDAEDIYMLTPDKMVEPRPGLDNSINTIPKKTYHPFVQDPDHVLPLVYGTDYQFRVRMMDISGGGPGAGDEPLGGGERPVADVHFKRYVAAGSLNILNVKDSYDSLGQGTDENPLTDTSLLENILSENNPVLRIQRPLLGYPAVVFTGKYQQPVEKLKAILADLPSGGDKQNVDIGLPDPDVTSFKVSVEVKSLEMDNVLSEGGKEPYILLYEKEYELPSAADQYDQVFQLNIVYRDFKLLDYESGFDDQGGENELVLPTARNLRLTFTPLIAAADNDYADEDIREGKKLRLFSFKASSDETELLSAVDGGLKGIYLQPEQPLDQRKLQSPKGYFPLKILSSRTPAEISRLADALNITAHNLTLEGEKGKRVQFGCSKLMRHSLAPDSSSLTFSSLPELFNHWILAVDYVLKRDWAWDALAVESVSIYRKWKNEEDQDYGAEELAGVIQISQTASVNALHEADRSSSRLIFLDAFDPKKTNDAFPSEIIISYRISVNFRPEFSGAAKDAEVSQEIHLPVTIVPYQVPRLVSAGIALSPYLADEEKYSSTEIRQRFLWLEMESPPADPNDSYFVRVLSNAPDPLLCSINAELVSYEPADPPLNINEEKIRVIIPGMNNDFAGIGAMQEMIPEDKPAGQARYYMVPLPPGLHADSDELFGCFSYEIRVGHKKELWSTAQGRYGRPLKVNGVQHPAPALTCNAYRRKSPLQHEIVVTAPFATAVLDGRNLTAKPPQTTLWYMLYTQVRQADGSSYRNLLIQSERLRYVPPRRQKEGGSSSLSSDEGKLFGIAVINVKEVEARLEALGLPPNNSLSVLCVEMFPLRNTWRIETARGVRTHSMAGALAEGGEEHDPAASSEVSNPLTDGLGRYRIYRTSPLVPVSGICCDDC